MNSVEIKAKIRDIITQVTNIPAETITDTASFRDDLNLDSLALLEIGVDVDYAFKLNLPDERLKEIGSLEDAVTLVETELAKRTTAAVASGAA